MKSQKFKNTPIKKIVTHDFHKFQKIGNLCFLKKG